MQNKFKDSEAIIEYSQKITMLILSASIFSVAIKYLQFLGVFKKDFEGIIMSPKFNTLLSEKIETLAYSEEHLIKQNNLERIWQTVTLCKYKRYFPEISEKTEKRMGDNPFFKEGALSYYYKNFQIFYDVNISPDEKSVIIKERCSFTIVRPSIEPFKFDFSTSYIKCGDNKGEVNFKVSNMSGMDFVIKDLNISPLDQKDGDVILMKVEKEVKGLREYHIEREVSIEQNLEKERTFSFSSDRIIDDITVNIKHCDKTEVVFQSVNNNKLHISNTGFDDYVTYINRDVFLPGEIFIMFFYKNGKK